MTVARMSVVCTVVATIAAACAAQVPNRSSLDSSGLTVVTQADAVMLARPVPALASGAQDLAYIGPVEINRMGQRRHYLWVALASTVDRNLLGVEPPHAVELALLVDNEPMTFSLSTWSTELDEPPYESNVPHYATFEATVSLDQIHRIARAGSVEFHILDDAGVTARYRKWQRNWESWSAFPQLR